MPNIIKTPAKKWLRTAIDALVEEGLAGVKIDRLAKTLNVTRGGFYHHFKDREDLLNRLIREWVRTNDFIPDVKNLSNAQDAIDKIEEMSDRVITEKNFSSAFEMAVREWARIAPQIRQIVDKADANRIKRLTTIFAALGYQAEEAPIRARVFYFHQIGYYSLGHQKHQTQEQRKKTSPVYMRIICGHRYINALEARHLKTA